MVLVSDKMVGGTRSTTTRGSPAGTATTGSSASKWKHDKAPAMETRSKTRSSGLSEDLRSRLGRRPGATTNTGIAGRITKRRGGASSPAVGKLRTGDLRERLVRHVNEHLRGTEREGKGEEEEEEKQPKYFEHDDRLGGLSESQLKWTRKDSTEARTGRVGTRDARDAREKKVASLVRGRGTVAFDSQENAGGKRGGGARGGRGGRGSSGVAGRGGKRGGGRGAGAGRSGSPNGTWSHDRFGDDRVRGRIGTAHMDMDD